MKERPILFSGAMVRAILSGRKTQTRRVVKPSFDVSRVTYGCIGGQGFGFIFGNKVVRCPFGELGHRLWVREEHAIVAAPGLTTGAKEVVVQVQFLDGERRCASLTAAELQKLRERRAWSLGDQTRGRFMYRSLSRITLEIVSVRVERLQDISEADAVAEGIHRFEVNGCEYFHARPTAPTEEHFNSALMAYRDLWESINGAGSWDANPWVWVVEFKKL